MAKISRDFLEIMGFEQSPDNVYAKRIANYIVLVTYEDASSEQANCYVATPLLFNMPHWVVSNLQDSIQLRDLIEYLKPTTDFFAPCDLSMYGFRSMGKSQSIRSGQLCVTAVTHANRLQITAHNGKMKIAFPGVCNAEDLTSLLSILFGSPEAV